MYARRIKFVNEKAIVRYHTFRYLGDHWEDLDVGGWTILIWILEK
jgi:hypothetical protein